MSAAEQHCATPAIEAHPAVALPYYPNDALEAGHENDPTTHGVQRWRALTPLPQESLPPPELARKLRRRL